MSFMQLENSWNRDPFQSKYCLKLIRMKIGVG